MTITIKGFKSFLAEGLSIGGHAESLYGRGYKHYGTMGAGSKQVHIFTPARGKPTHHFLLKHDGADPVRHEGNPDLKAIKAMTEGIVSRVGAAITHGAAQTHLAGLSGPENLSTGPGGMAVPAAYGAAHAVDHLTGGRISGAIGKVAARFRRNEAVDVQAIQKARDTKAQRKDKNIQTQNVKEETAEEHAKRMKLLDTVQKNLERQRSGVDEYWPPRRKVDSAREASRNAQKKKMNETQKEGVTVAIPVDIGGKRYSAVNGQAYVHATQTVGNGRWNTSQRKMSRKLKPGPHHDKIIAALEKHKAERYKTENIKEENKNMKQDITEGWLFGTRYKRIGNKQATHRVTFFHAPTGSKHTIDVTAPTDHHAVAHVHRHVLGGRNGAAPIKVQRIQHLHEGAVEEENLQEVSKSTLKSYVKKAEKSMDDTYKNEKSPKKWDQVTWKRAVGLVRAEKRLDKKEDLDEALEIRYAVNHPDIHARHHAREYKKAQTAYHAGHAKLASQYRAPTRDQEDELMNHYEVAAHHHREYKKRLGQLEAGKNEDLVTEAMKDRTVISVHHPKHGRIGTIWTNPHDNEVEHEHALTGMSWSVEGKTKAHSIKLAKAHLLDHHEGHLRDLAWNAKHKMKDMDEGLVSKITNAAKTLYKKSQSASTRIAQTREKVGFDNAKNKDLSPRGNALRKVEKIEWAKANPVKKKKDLVPMGKVPDKFFENAGLAHRINHAIRGRSIAKSKSDAAWNHADENEYDGKPADAAEKASSAFLNIAAGNKGPRFGSRREELEIRPGQKVLKELPKRGADGKLTKSKAAQKVEDCIKLSGKKEKIDTEPTYNPLVTAGGSAGGTSNF